MKSITKVFSVGWDQPSSLEGYKNLYVKISWGWGQGSGRPLPLAKNKDKGESVVNFMIAYVLKGQEI